MNSAATGVLADVFVFAGLGAAVLSFVPSVRLDGDVALLAVAAVMVISYALARRRA